MNPYDRRAVQAVWSRVAPGQRVFERASGGKPPGIPAAQTARELLERLARGYDALAAQKRLPIFRQMAARCRQDADRLSPGEGASIAQQQSLEAELADLLQMQPELQQRCLARSKALQRFR